MKNASRVIWLIFIGSLLTAHVALCFRFCGTFADLGTDAPFLTDDHTLHYASALTTKRFLSESGLNAGYDPDFMAGYVKSTYWPTNTLLELWMLVSAEGLRPALAYKCFVLVSAMALPVAVAAATLMLGQGPGISALAMVLSILIYWHHWPFHTVEYVRYGMTAFVYSVSSSLLALAAAQRWLVRKTWNSAVLAGFLGGVALMSHPTTAVTLGPPLLVAWLMNVRGQPRNLIRQALVAAAIALLINYWWLVPLVVFRDTVGGSPGFFNNPNVLERLGILFKGDPESPLPWMPPLFTVVLLFAVANGLRTGWLPLLAVLWIFILAIPAGAFPQLNPLQLGRNTFVLLAWMIPPAASFLFYFWSRFPRGRPLIIIVFLLLSIGIGPRLWENVRVLLVGHLRSSTAEMYPEHTALLAKIRSVAEGKRVLFEAYEASNEALERTGNPFGSIRLAPLVPRQAGVECIGGPYLATHYLTNYVNCGDGFLFGGRWQLERVEALASQYAIDVAVVWSQPARLFADTFPDIMKPIASVGLCRIYQIQRQKTPWEAAGITVTADINQLTVRNPMKAKGEYVLPFHYFRGWSSISETKINGKIVWDDPVPMLTIVDPPEELVLRFSPWTALWIGGR